MSNSVYDNPEFFATYRQMSRSVDGPQAGMEWPHLQAMFPDFLGKRVLDLGCGFGGLCRYVSDQGAASVVGVDNSERMLADARARTTHSNIEYRLGSMDDIKFRDGSFDVVLSTLALHYVESLWPLFSKIAGVLVPGGSFVMSFEHPMFTARAEQSWFESDDRRLHWPVDGYQDEGPRQTRFLGGSVLKYHRTTATYVNSLVDAGFRIERLLEPGPTAEQLAVHPDWSDEARRPIFMLIGTVKQVQ